MAVLEVPEAAAALAAFVVVSHLLLYCLLKGFLPELRQMIVGFMLTALLFGLCSVLVRDSCLLCVRDPGVMWQVLPWSRNGSRPTARSADTSALKARLRSSSLTG